ncbi:MAG: hypothetical protein CM1200mP39_17560 [Dehalococcoidia bacterium]|nr:MAG: hypothetical protein CM1200mP39_17560 [Dehalococcoidia bacterium]
MAKRFRNLQSHGYSKRTVSVALAGSVTPGKQPITSGATGRCPRELKNEIDDLVISEGSGVGMPGMEIAT